MERRKLLVLGDKNLSNDQKHSNVAGLLHRVFEEHPDEAQDANLEHERDIPEICCAVRSGAGAMFRDVLTGIQSIDAVVLFVKSDVQYLEQVMSHGDQVLEHLRLTVSLGIRSVTVCCYGYSSSSSGPEEAQHLLVVHELEKLLELAGYSSSDVQCVPICELSKELKSPSWYAGAPIQDTTMRVAAKVAMTQRPLRVPIEEVFKVRGSEVMAFGCVESGVLHTDVDLLLLPGGGPVRARRIESGRCIADSVQPGGTACLMGLHMVKNDEMQPVQVAAGAVLSEARKDPAAQCRRLLAVITILHAPPGIKLCNGFQTILHVHTAHVPCILAELLKRRRHGDEHIYEQHPPVLEAGDVASVWVEPLDTVCVEVFSFCPPLGRIALHHEGMTLAAGIIEEVQTVADQYAYFDD